MPYRKKRQYMIPLACICTAAAIAAGAFIGLHFHQKKRDAEFAARITVQLDNAVVKIRTAESERATLLSETYEKLKAEREEEERRIAEQKRLEEERRKAEEERIAAQKKAEEERIAAEKKRAEEEERRKAAEEAAKQAEVIAAEKAKAEAEKAERKRISAQIKAQEANAAAENNEYWSRGITPVVDLGIRAILQNPELPNGCEVTALATVINSLNSYVSKTTLSDIYLPQFPFYTVGADKQRAGGDPNLYFAGNPRSSFNAYYCFAGPIVSAANSYFSAVGMSNTAIDLTGADEAQLVHQLDMGYPVIAWGTLSMGDAYTFAPNAWIINEETGEKHIPFLNLHCVVLTGYDDEFFLLADPIRGNVAVRRSTFMNAYRQIGSRAVVIY